MKKFRDFLNEELKNPELKQEWDALEEDFNSIREKLDNDYNLTSCFEDSPEDEVKHG